MSRVKGLRWPHPSSFAKSFSWAGSTLSADFLGRHPTVLTSPASWGPQHNPNVTFTASQMVSLSLHSRDSPATQLGSAASCNLGRRVYNPMILVAFLTLKPEPLWLKLLGLAACLGWLQPHSLNCISINIDSLLLLFRTREFLRLILSEVTGSVRWGSPNECTTPFIPFCTRQLLVSFLRTFGSDIKSPGAILLYKLYISYLFFILALHKSDH